MYEFKGNVLIIIVDCLGTWFFVSSVVIIYFHTQPVIIFCTLFRF